MRVLPTTVLVLLALPACVTEVASGATDDDAVAIRALAERFGSGFVAGDPDAVARCVTEDFIAMTPGEPAVQGRDVVRAKVAQDLATMAVRELAFDVQELHVQGDWAWARAASRATVMLRASKEVREIRGKTLWIFRRGADGAWRIARDASSGDDA